MRVLIADDDVLVTDQLRHFAEKLGATAVTVVHSGTDALAALRKGGFDLLTLDVHMPGLTGPELLAAVGPSLPVIIVSGDRAFAVEGYRYNVVDYLVKPVDLAAFARAWNKAQERGSPPLAANTVFVRVGNDIVRLDLDEVRFIRSDSNYVRFVLADREVTSLMNLKDLERKLPPDFVRVHRSYIVNLRHVDKLDSQDIKIGRELVPVSDSYREELLRRLALL
jgi:DNA-binding LytR/AlgR family response regulator